MDWKIFRTIYWSCNLFGSMVLKTVLDTILQKNHVILSSLCFEQFSITFDGTPSFLEMEAVVIRVAANK